MDHKLVLVARAAMRRVASDQVPWVVRLVEVGSNKGRPAHTCPAYLKGQGDIFDMDAMRLRPLADGLLRLAVLGRRQIHK